MTDRVWKVLNVLVWFSFCVVFVVGLYVNWYMPHGPMIDTGEVVCQNDDRGPCGESYIEDTRGLNIPEWAKFFRTSSAELLLMGLLFAGIITGNRPEGGYKKEV